MGVRRGWLSLLHPQINDWPDVFKAFDRLIQFLDNLEQQVTYVRRAPSSVLKGLKEEDDKIRETFKAIRELLKEKRRTAEHWFRAHKDPEEQARGAKPEEGEKMLSVYKEHFEGALEVHVKTRKDPKKNRWNDTRPGHITELVDKLLELLREQANTLQKNIETENGVGQGETKTEYEDSAFKEFSYGHMKVIVTDPKMHGALIRKYIQYVDEAYQRLSSKGFTKLWYGVMFLESSETEKLSPAETAAYAALGYKNLRERAGRYHEGEDIFYLDQPPAPWLAQSIVHELGHRLWYKFLTQRQRFKFEELVKVRPEKVQKNWIPTPIATMEPKVLNDALAKVDAAAKEVEKAIRKFERSKESYRRDLNESGYLYGADIAFNRTFMDVRGNFPMDGVYTQKLTERFQTYSRAHDTLHKHLFNVDTTIGSQMNAMPDGTIWQEVYNKTLKPEWVKEARALLVVMVATANDWFKSAFTTHNEVAEEQQKTYAGNATPDPVVDAEGFDPNDSRTVLPVSDYGRSHIREAFAEVFTHYVYDKGMTIDQRESFLYVMKHASTIAERVTDRFVERAL